MSGTSIRNKSHYSCGIAIGTAKQFIQSAKEKGLSSIAITDFSTLGGSLDFYNQGKRQNFKVAIGCEFKIDNLEPIALYCYNQEGYTNLCRLVTSSNLNNKELSVQDLYDHRNGLYCLTAEFQHNSVLKPIFADNLYFEIRPYPSDYKRNEDIINNIEENRIVVSCDSYMPNAEDKILQDIMVQNSTFGSKEVLFDHPRYLMSAKEQIINFVKNYPLLIPQNILVGGIKRAEKIVEHCSEIELKFQDQIVNYPHLLHPLNPDGVDKLTLLRRILNENNRWDSTDQRYSDRIEMEIDAITNNSRVNLIDYFLVLEDLCRYCRDNDIPVGPGRGSGAGSLVLYGLQVTNLDPIKYGLLFERFISKGRIEAGTLPDVDLDFANQEVVRQYLISLYGEDRVKPIGTYQTLATRGALKDAFRTLYPEVEFWQMNKITGAIDDGLREEGDSETQFFNRQLKENETFAKLMEPFPKVKDAVIKLVGFNRQPGIHPCGLAITQDPIKDFMPIRFTKEKEVLEFQAEDCESSGVIKYDILGLKTLKFFQSCLRNIKDRYENDNSGFDYPKSIYDIPLDDRMTYKAFEAGDTESVFQFNSNVAKAILTKIKINSLDDLSMVTSVGRPGPMNNGQHYDFIKRKNGEKEPTPPHPALKELLEDTLGVMIYQESVMKCAQLMGGYSLAETDNIRKAMGKKKLEILLPYKEGFIKNCQEKYPDTKQMMPPRGDGEPTVSIAENIWNLMETFSGYGFNKSHSMCYTLIGYYCQYLKVHYPLEWWSACLEHAGGPEHTKRFYSAFRNRILLPSINLSTDHFRIIYEDRNIQDENGDDVEGWIVMPFGSVKNVGDKASRAIQDSAPYKDFEDFFNRVNKRQVNKRVVINLIFAGAFDSFEKDKEKLLSQYYTLRKEKKIPPEHQNITRDYELEMKYQVMDFLTLDYIDVHSSLLHGCKYPEQINGMKSDEEVNIVGKITEINKRKIKKGDNAGKEFYVMDVVNNDEPYSVIVWPEQVGIYKHNLEKNNVVVISGKTKKDWNDKSQVTAKSIHTINEIRKFGGLNP